VPVCVCVSEKFVRGGGPYENFTEHKHKHTKLGYVSDYGRTSLCLCFVFLCDQNAPTYGVIPNQAAGSLFTCSLLGARNART
jgi:hypothetical protein